MTVDERTTDPSGNGGSAEDVVRLDWREFDEPSAGIVQAATRATGRQPTDLPPLHEAVETDALNVLLADDARDVVSPVRITFRYAGLLTTVSGTGDVVVRNAGR